MVLVRSESGQLLMIPQQTLAHIQAQSQSQSAMTPRPAVPTSTPPVQITSLQVLEQMNHKCHKANTEKKRDLLMMAHEA